MESSKISPGAVTPAETPCGDLAEQGGRQLFPQTSERERPTLKPLPLSDPFISLTSFDARTKPEPTDKPSLELCFFLVALSIYNFLLGLEMGQDVKVRLVRRASDHCEL